MSQNIMKYRKNSSMPVPKHVSVSLDCVLGLLSSAYGTDQIDPAIFDKNRFKTSTCENILVEGFKQDDKLKCNTLNTLKENLCLEDRIKGKICVATSTSSLKYDCTEGVEDKTGMMKHKLHHPKLILHEQKPIHSESKFVCLRYDLDKGGTKSSLNSFEEVPKLSYIGLDPPPNYIGEFIDNNQYDPESVICGFHANGDYLTFDIKFTKMHSTSCISSDLNKLLSNSDDIELTIKLKDSLKSCWTRVNVSKKSLISKSQHFCNVDKKFCLENLDVFVKCSSLNTLEWIFQWLNSKLPMYNPILTTSNVNGILFIAHNLQIDQLIEDCLDFFYVNYSKPGCQNVDSCLDKLMLKLVVKFSNSEIDLMDNGFEILQSKLFSALIQTLADKIPCKTIGHYRSLASIFECQHCQKIFHSEMSESVACRADCNKLIAQGKFVPIHECSISWNLSMYIEFLYKQLKSWRKVYWRLWGMCHFLTCNYCNVTYPVCQSEWCAYHSGLLEYFPMSATLSHPIGVYSCCGEISFKFNVLDLYAGCKYQSHVPVLDCTDDEHINKIYQTHKGVINLEPPISNATLNKNVRLIRKCDEIQELNVVKRESFWWEGIQITPKLKEDYSIIPRKLFDKLKNRSQSVKNSTLYSEFNELQVAMGSVPMLTHTLTSYSTDDHDCEKVKFNLSYKTKPSPKLTKHRMKKKISLPNTYDQVELQWYSSESLIYNQDNQREFEEVVMHSLVETLSLANAGLKPKSSAGTYTRLEEDWWQNNYHDSKISGTKNAQKFPLSSIKKT